MKTNYVIIIQLSLLILWLSLCQAQRSSSIGVGRGRSGSSLTFGSRKNDSSSSRSSSGVNFGDKNRSSSTSFRSRPKSTAAPIETFSGEKEPVTVGLMLPLSRFHSRDYGRAVYKAFTYLQKGIRQGELIKHIKFTADDVKMYMISVSPSPQGKHICVAQK